ncbi:MAG: InlB B-repeat-containing protein, partial [Ruminococcus sp.]|nr:InlB B-repeat-containing protein [Candidatus Apopatosoma intestinale]
MNNKIKKLISVLAVLLLLFSALPLGVLADNTTDITAEVDHPYTMTILPHPHGQLLYIAPEMLYQGDTVSFTPTPDEGYVLKSLGWYTTDPASPTDITESKILTMPDADVTVAAEFALLCNVTFDMQGHGTQVQGYTGVVAGSRIDAPASPTASGTVFGGWYKEAGCTTAWNFEADAVTDHMTLYAKWIGDSNPSASISGNVTEGGVNVPGATVEL